MQDLQVHGYVRKPLEAVDAVALGTSEQPIVLNPQLEQLVAPGASPWEEITRVGRSFQVHTAAAIAAVVAIPTTAHMLALYNAEPEGGRSLIIDFVAASNVVSTAVASQATLLGLVGQLPEVAPTDAALGITKLNGNGAGQDTQVMTILNATALSAATGLAANWFPLGPSAGKPGAAATPGYAIWADVNGRIIVPPKRFFAVHVLANVVGETFLAYIGWHERQLALG